ncbi:MAG TPA: hypothetical protein PKV98_03600 [Burkholderiaceae bacterium]|nr:hypothetical protein [Burkholderiaceae bacterium]
MKPLLAVVGACAWVSAAGAAPAVVGDDACTYYAVDVADFATCDESGVAMPEDVPLAIDAPLAEDSVSVASRTFEALDVDTRRAVCDTIIDGYEGELGPGGQRPLDGWMDAGLPWTARVNADLVSTER